MWLILLMKMKEQKVTRKVFATFKCCNASSEIVHPSQTNTHVSTKDCPGYRWRVAAPTEVHSAHCSGPGRGRTRAFFPGFCVRLQPTRDATDSCNCFFPFACVERIGGAINRYTGEIRETALVELCCLLSFALSFLECLAVSKTLNKTQGISVAISTSVAIKHGLRKRSYY